MQVELPVVMLPGGFTGKLDHLPTDTAQVATKRFDRMFQVGKEHEESEDKVWDMNKLQPIFNLLNAWNHSAMDIFFIGRQMSGNTVLCGSEQVFFPGGRQTLVVVGDPVELSIMSKSGPKRATSLLLDHGTAITISGEVADACSFSFKAKGERSILSLFSDACIPESKDLARL